MSEVAGLVVAGLLGSLLGNLLGNLLGTFLMALWLTRDAGQGGTKYKELVRLGVELHQAWSDLFKHG